MTVRTSTSLGLAALGALLALVVALPPLALGQRVARVGGPAPELTGGPWINSPSLSLEKLRGRVVFVEFWTYG